MPYNYFLSGSSAYFNSPQQTLFDGYQEFINNQFNISPNVFIIKKEGFLGSGSYIDTTVRIESAVDENTGIKLGDDFKILLFADLGEEIYIGEKYYFDDNYWLTVNTSRIKGLTNKATVRRCNNILRWTDIDGNIFSESCIIDYKIATPNNRYRADPIVSEGTITVISQLNDNTNQIRENQRFLFGNSDNWMGYKIYGGGILNYLNNETLDNSTVQLVQFSMGKNFVNSETDDIVLGIADRYKFLPSGSAVLSSIQILPASGSVIEGESQTFTCYLYSSGSQQSGSFIFSVDSSSVVPNDKYILTTLGDNSFSIENVERYLPEDLPIKCVAGSGSRIKFVSLRGDW